MDKAMKFDIIVVGGGPAGMMSAIAAAEYGAQVCLLEPNERLGKKLNITGKGRCNVTNHCTPHEVLQNIPRNGRFLYSAMENHPPKAVMEFLEGEGCPLKTERGNRVFPVSDKSQSVLEALRSAAVKAGVTIRTARAMEMGEIQGAMSSIAIGVCGLISVVISLFLTI